MRDPIASFGTATTSRISPYDRANVSEAPRDDRPEFVNWPIAIFVADQEGAATRRCPAWFRRGARCTNALAFGKSEQLGD
jgi:hypothetical protein